MAKLTTAEQLADAIRAAARDAEATAPSMAVAEDLYETHTSLVDQFARNWVLEKIAYLIRKQRSKARRAANPQMFLDPSFEKLPLRLDFADGKRVRMGKATFQDLRKFRAQIWKMKHPALESIDRAIATMRPYIERAPGITWEQVMKIKLKDH
jgi:hypothetical protein